MKTIKSLERLCQDYIINVYDTAHADDVPYALALAAERRDIHNLILAKLGVERTDDIQWITDNLDNLNDNGKSFDVHRKHTTAELEAIGHYLRCGLEVYCSKHYPKRTVLECINDKLDNFTKGETYFSNVEYHDELEEIRVIDDKGMIYDIDVELEIKDEFRDFRICY